MLKKYALKKNKNKKNLQIFMIIYIDFGIFWSKPPIYSTVQHGNYSSMVNSIAETKHEVRTSHLELITLQL